jgi:hypothetical protein
LQEEREIELSGEGDELLSYARPRIIYPLIIQLYRKYTLLLYRSQCKRGPMDIGVAAGANTARFY